VIFAHYDRKTGHIVQITQSSHPFEREGYGCALVHDAAVLNGPHRVLLGTVQMGEFGWDYAAVEPFTPPLTVSDVKSRRDTELAATDALMVPDRPLEDEVRSKWREYRQALRDLGSFGSAEQMIAAWPFRPEGHDAVADWRPR
jgi:hypothetical protein